MSPLVIVVLVLLAAMGLLLGLVLWALDQMRGSWPFPPPRRITRRQRRAWAKERLPFARVVERSTRRG